MQYHTYSVEDFITDESFKSWVKAPTQDSILFWEQWLAAHPEKQNTVEEARRTILLLHFKQYNLPEQEAKTIWQNIQREKNKPYQPGYSKPKTKVISFPNFSQFSKWAAVFIGLLLCSSILFWVFILNHTQKYTTSYGETKTLSLPDGSVVTLNANSVLSYSSNWDTDKPREVWLEGEAFFEVVKKTQTAQLPSGDAKFVVHAADVNVEVLGTEFNVNNRRKTTRVTLSSGKVKLDLQAAHIDKPVMMKPGESVEFSSVDKKVTKSAVNPTLYTSWTSKKLIFDDTPLSEVAKTIEDIYGIQVSFEDSTHAKRKIRGAIPTKDVDILLAALSNTFNLKIIKHENQILIKRKN